MQLWYYMLHKHNLVQAYRDCVNLSHGDRFWCAEHWLTELLNVFKHTCTESILTSKLYSMPRYQVKATVMNSICYMYMYRYVSIRTVWLPKKLPGYKESVLSNTGYTSCQSKNRDLGLQKASGLLTIRVVRVRLIETYLCMYAQSLLSNPAMTCVHECLLFSGQSSLTFPGFGWECKRQEPYQR